MCVVSTLLSPYCRKLLNTNLFSADVFLQKAILQVHALCESASISAVSHYFENDQRDSTRFAFSLFVCFIEFKHE